MSPCNVCGAWTHMTSEHEKYASEFGFAMKDYAVQQYASRLKGWEKPSQEFYDDGQGNPIPAKPAGVIAISPNVVFLTPDQGQSWQMEYPAVVLGVESKTGDPEWDEHDYGDPFLDFGKIVKPSTPSWSVTVRYAQPTLKHMGVQAAFLTLACLPGPKPSAAVEALSWTGPGLEPLHPLNIATAAAQAFHKGAGTGQADLAKLLTNAKFWPEVLSMASGEFQQDMSAAEFVEKHILQGVQKLTPYQQGVIDKVSGANVKPKGYPKDFGMGKKMPLVPALCSCGKEVSVDCPVHGPELQAANAQSPEFGKKPAKKVVKKKQKPNEPKVSLKDAAKKITESLESMSGGPGKLSEALQKACSCPKDPFIVAKGCPVHAASGPLDIGTSWHAGLDTPETEFVVEKPIPWDQPGADPLGDIKKTKAMWEKKAYGVTPEPKFDGGVSSPVYPGFTYANTGKSGMHYYDCSKCSADNVPETSVEAHAVKHAQEMKESDFPEFPGLVFDHVGPMTKKPIYKCQSCANLLTFNQAPKHMEKQHPEKVTPKEENASYPGWTYVGNNTTNNVNFYKCIECGDKNAAVPEAFLSNHEKVTHGKPDTPKWVPGQEIQEIPVIPGFKYHHPNSFSGEPMYVCTQLGCSGKGTSVALSSTKSHTENNHMKSEHHPVIPGWTYHKTTPNGYYYQCDVCGSIRLGSKTDYHDKKLHPEKAKPANVLTAEQLYQQASVIDPWDTLEPEDTGSSAMQTAKSLFDVETPSVVIQGKDVHFTKLDKHGNLMPGWSSVAFTNPVPISYTYTSSGGNQGDEKLIAYIKQELAKNQSTVRASVTLSGDGKANVHPWQPKANPASTKKCFGCGYAISTFTKYGQAGKSQGSHACTTHGTGATKATCGYIHGDREPGSCEQAKKRFYTLKMVAQQWDHNQTLTGEQNKKVGEKYLQEKIEAAVKAEALKISKKPGAAFPALKFWWSLQQPTTVNDLFDADKAATIAEEAITGKCTQCSGKAHTEGQQCPATLGPVGAKSHKTWFGLFGEANDWLSLAESPGKGDFYGPSWEKMLAAKGTGMSATDIADGVKLLATKQGKYFNYKYLLSKKLYAAWSEQPEPEDAPKPVKFKKGGYIPVGGGMMIDPNTGMSYTPDGIPIVAAQQGGPAPTYTFVQSNTEGVNWTSAPPKPEPLKVQEKSAKTLESLIAQHTELVKDYRKQLAAKQAKEPEEQTEAESWVQGIDGEVYEVAGKQYPTVDSMTLTSLGEGRARVEVEFREGMPYADAAEAYKTICEALGVESETRSVSGEGISW